MPTRISLFDESSTCSFEGAVAVVKKDEEVEKGNNKNVGNTTSGESDDLTRQNNPQAATRTDTKVPISSSTHKLVHKERQKDFSSTDLTASPRLLGYAFSMVASMVCLVSSAKFEHISEYSDGGIGFTEGFHGSVKTWKARGAIAFSGASLLICCIIIGLHFDNSNKCSRKIFRDGSQYERFILMFLIVYWSVGVHVCTSTGSVGFISPNVYFSSWLALVAVINNYDRWRVGAGRKAYYEIARESPSPTTYSLSVMAIFSVITFLAILDAYVVILRYEEELELHYQDIRTHVETDLKISGATFALALPLISMNHYSSFWAGKNTRRMRLSLVCWNWCEGLCLSSLVMLWVSFVFKETGLNRYVNGVNNIYFGAWGIFLTSLMSFGTWLKEKAGGGQVRQE